MLKKSFLLILFTSICLSGCGKKSDDDQLEPTDFEPEITYKTITKETYLNKTLGGLLGQFAGFLSGYEFSSWTEPSGLPEYFFEFLNGPYAGNYTYFTPSDTYRYCRLNNASTGELAVWSDDDYHIDIFNQYILKELGPTSYAIKETWKKYKVSDWGGGSDAMMLINSKDMLAPFTGTIEAGNRYGWCTEAYIENETLGMNAPGMPNTAVQLIDKFGSNVGYFDSLIWAKFYGAMYSFAYFESDVKVVMEKASEVLPKNSYPRKTYEKAFEIYNKYPNDYKKAARELAKTRRNLYRIDNYQTDPNVNGGFAILSFLFGENDYMKTAKYSSIMGYDGDCTAAICCGLMGILKGFNSQNEEYSLLNSKLYHDGRGVYVNDTETNFQAKILSKDYPKEQKIDDIVKMYQENFEKILLNNGGEDLGTSYKIPTTDLVKDHTLLFTNYDAEERDNSGFKTNDGKLTNLTETENINSHTGFAYFKFINSKKGSVYHSYNLTKGHKYRVVAYVKTGENVQASLFAENGSKKDDVNEITFANQTSLIAKSLTFVATNSVMNVGFRFDDKASSGDYVMFDDFMLEEINEKTYQQIEGKLNPVSKKFTKMISKPTDVKIGEEVLLRVQYRQYSGSPISPIVLRNGKTFGGIVLSSTSNNSTSGFDYVNIPYIFEKESDTVSIDLGDERIFAGSIEICKQCQYSFR